MPDTARHQRPRQILGCECRRPEADSAVGTQQVVAVPMRLGMPGEIHHHHVLRAESGLCDPLLHPVDEGAPRRAVGSIGEDGLVAHRLQQPADPGRVRFGAGQVTEVGFPVPPDADRDQETAPRSGASGPRVRRRAYRRELAGTGVVLFGLVPPVSRSPLSRGAAARAGSEALGKVGVHFRERPVVRVEEGVACRVGHERAQRPRGVTARAQIAGHGVVGTPLVERSGALSEQPAYTVMKME